MDFFLKALLLGIVEGLTEFLPISSTGHLIIAADLLDYTGEKAKTFEVMIQLGAILAVCWLYRARLAFVARGLTRAPEARRFTFNVGLAFLPAAALGFLLHTYIKAYLFTPVVVACALIGGGVAILAIERLAGKPRVEAIDAIGWKQALQVGLAQAAALIPGVSRSGATIMGGLAFGLSRRTATEFSFFLAIPTMFAAFAYDLYQHRFLLSVADIGVFTTGFVSAFLSALVAVKFLLHYIAHHDFSLFAWYRIAFGCLVLAFSYYSI